MTKKNKTISGDREKSLAIIASKIALGIKSSAENIGFTTSSDLISATLFAGVIIERNIPNLDDQTVAFSDVIDDYIPLYSNMILKDTSSAFLLDMPDMKETTSFASQSDPEDLSRLGFIIYEDLSELARVNNFSNLDKLKIIAFCCTYSFIANSDMSDIDYEISSLLMNAFLLIEEINDTILPDLELGFDESYWLTQNDEEVVD